jgi:hypothetical protein
MIAPYTNEELAKLGADAAPQRGVYCPRCKSYIPSFAVFDAKEEARLRASRVSGFTELKERTGCNALFAKIWFIHPDGPHAQKERPPCPYCGTPLFTPKSRQCLHCGWDWHDAAHPVRHAVKKEPNQAPEPTAPSGRGSS